jgi:hypothetical protein
MTRIGKKHRRIERVINETPINNKHHLQTSFWHCNMLLRNCDIDMTFLSQNFRVFPRAMSLVPEVCPISQNTSHTYVSTCHI